MVSRWKMSSVRISKNVCSLALEQWFKMKLTFSLSQSILELRPQALQDDTGDFPFGILPE